MEQHEHDLLISLDTNVRLMREEYSAGFGLLRKDLSKLRDKVESMDDKFDAATADQNKICKAQLLACAGRVESNSKQKQDMSNEIGKKPGWNILIPILGALFVLVCGAYGYTWLVKAALAAVCGHAV